jgi:hypothetical protein
VLPVSSYRILHTKVILLVWQVGILFSWNLENANKLSFPLTRMRMCVCTTRWLYFVRSWTDMGHSLKKSFSIMEKRKIQIQF